MSILLSGQNVLDLASYRYGGYSEKGWGRGVRSLVFRSSLPSDEIDTYILLEDGTVRARVLLNGEYK